MLRGLFQVLLVFGLTSLMAFTHHPIELLSEAELPAEAGVWSGCCSHHDCVEGHVEIYQNPDPNNATVAIDNYEPFPLERYKIHRSKNGRNYFCRRNLTRPPDTKNTRCVFVDKPNYVFVSQLSRLP